MTVSNPTLTHIPYNLQLPFTLKNHNKVFKKSNLSNIFEKDR